MLWNFSLVRVKKVGADLINNQQNSIKFRSVPTWQKFGLDWLDRVWPNIWLGLSRPKLACRNLNRILVELIPIEIRLNSAKLSQAKLAECGVVGLVQNLVKFNQVGYVIILIKFGRVDPDWIRPSWNRPKFGQIWSSLLDSNLIEFKYFKLTNIFFKFNFKFLYIKIKYY